MCYVAGWGQLAPKGELSDTLQEVELTVQKDQECESRFPRRYNKTIQICVGDPKINRTASAVSWIVLLSGLHVREKQSGTNRLSINILLCPLVMILLPGNSSHSN